MIITCPKCTNGIADGVNCVYCDGDGELDLLDPKFKELAESDFRELTGTIWNEILTNLSDFSDKLDDVMDKCNDIFEKVSE